MKRKKNLQAQFFLGPSRWAIYWAYLFTSGPLTEFPRIGDISFSAIHVAFKSWTGSWAGRCDQQPRQTAVALNTSHPIIRLYAPSDDPTLLLINGRGSSEHVPLTQRRALPLSLWKRSSPRTVSSSCHLHLPHSGRPRIDSKVCDNLISLRFASDRYLSDYDHSKRFRLISWNSASVCVSLKDIRVL